MLVFFKIGENLEHFITDFIVFYGWVIGPTLVLILKVDRVGKQ